MKVPKKSGYAKLRLVMRIGMIQVTMALMCGGLSMAATNHAQLLDRNISLSLSEIAFTEALKEIEARANISFVYSVDQLSDERPVTLQATDKSLREILDELLTPRHISYKVYEKDKTLSLKKQLPERQPGPKFRDRANTQTQDDRLEVSGTVTDAATQQPMPGVNVLIKGTVTGTSTDSQGRFRIEAPTTSTLIFSFIGYKTIELMVGTQTEINISMAEDVASLREVVVNAGYWEVTEERQTGSISRVTAKDIDKQPVANLLMAIQGRMPGVVITQTSGVPGSGMKIQIRGQNSLRNSSTDNGNYPLYVIDGVPVDSSPIESQGMLLNIGGIDPLNTLNPANIASIEILKDADATAIYGSRGANGVVLITTKRGNAEATSLDVQAYVGAGKASKMMEVMNTPQYLAMRREAFSNDGAVPGVADYDLNGTWSEQDYTNWQKKIFGETAVLSNVLATLSGGNAFTSFRLGSGFHKESTIFPGDFGYKKVTSFLNLNHATQDQKFRLSLSINYGADNNNLFSKNIISDALTLPPNAPLFNDDGSLNWNGYTSDRMHPFSYFNISHNSKTNTLISNAVLHYTLLDGLTAVTNLGFTEMNTSQTINKPQASMNPAAPVPSNSNFQDFRARNWIIEPQLKYAAEIAKGRLDILTGVTWQENKSYNRVIEGEGYTSDALLGNIKAASTVTVGKDVQTTYRYHALFGRIGYNWDDKYLINLTARRDGSSRFGPDNKFGNFGALGAAWIFSNEQFAQALKWLSFGKIRSSYGSTGNDRIGDYGYLSTYTPYSLSYGGRAILNTTALSNPNYGWEVNKKLEAALDLGFIKDKIRTSVSWYRNRSSNQLVGYPLPAVAGFTTIQYNLDATVQNTGWEFEIRSTNIESKKTTWTSAVNFTIPRNELLTYPNIEGSSYANTYVVGYPLTISKRYYFGEVNPQTGVYEMLDVNEDGVFNNADRQSILDLSRRFYGGIQNVLKINSLEISFLLELVKQEATGYMGMFTNPPGSMSNQLAMINEKERWQQPGDQAEIQKFTQSFSAGYLRAITSDLNRTDASYIRLKTIAISYALSEKWLSKIKINQCRLYIQAQNLLTITNYFGLNPESPFLELPPLKVISTGFQLKI